MYHGNLPDSSKRRKIVKNVLENGEPTRRLVCLLVSVKVAFITACCFVVWAWVSSYISMKVEHDAEGRVK